MIYDELIPPPPAGHSCDLPTDRGVLNSTRRGTLFVCNHCGISYVLGANYADDWGPPNAWHRVRWYHRTARRRLRDLGYR